MKKIFNYTSPKDVLGVLFIGVFLLISTHYTYLYKDVINSLIKDYYTIGVFVYVFAMFFLVLFIPISTIPIVPVATGVFGTLEGALLTAIAWIVGGITAFHFSKKHKNTVIRFSPVLGKLASVLDNNVVHISFLRLAVLKMVLPVGVGSYIFGLSKSLRIKRFVYVSIVEAFVVLFMIATATTLPPFYQQIAILVFILFLFRGVLYLRSLLKKAD